MTLKPAQEYANLLSDDLAKQLILTSAIRQAQVDTLRYAAWLIRDDLNTPSSRGLKDLASQLEQSQSPLLCLKGFLSTPSPAKPDPSNST